MQIHRALTSYQTWPSMCQINLTVLMLHLLKLWSKIGTKEFQKQILNPIATHIKAAVFTNENQTCKCFKVNEPQVAMLMTLQNSKSVIKSQTRLFKKSSNSRSSNSKLNRETISSSSKMKTLIQNLLERMSSLMRSPIILRSVMATSNKD